MTEGSSTKSCVDLANIEFLVFFENKQSSERMEIKESGSHLEGGVKSGAVYFGYVSQNSAVWLHVTNYEEDRKCGLLLA